MDASASCLCHICGGSLLPIDGFSVLAQVTSDCRPWRTGGTLASCKSCGTVQKPVTPEWLAEADAIYAEYAIYSQSGGVEQATFTSDNGAAVARSKLIVQWLDETGSLPKEGAVLDIGCGNGAFLRAFAERHPEWRLNGLELSDKNRSVIESIPGVERLFVGAIEQVEERFDLIVLIHALEHIPDPSRYLATLRGRLKPGGLLLIEVPDLATSPFDILIADHTTHFTRGVLADVVADAGYALAALDCGYVAKELSVLARNVSEASPDAKTNAVSTPSQSDRQFAASHIAWLRTMLAQAEQVEGALGIFGTSIAATWLAASLDGRVRFFVDEDPHRVGRQHMDLPIYAPGMSPDRVPVMIPLRADIAHQIALRHADLAVQYILPPV